MRNSKEVDSFSPQLTLQGEGVAIFMVEEETAVGVAAVAMVLHDTATPTPTTTPASAHQTKEDITPNKGGHNSKPICQICKKTGHEAPSCWFRYE